jgi:hypothetical protein
MGKSMTIVYPICTSFAHEPIRHSIQHLALALGVPYKYHETLTVF